MNLGRVLNQTVYVAPVTGTDAHGKPAYGTPVANKVRVEARRQVVNTASGEEAIANHRLWCAVAINLTDRIWLPGANPSDLEASNLPLVVSSSADFGGGTTLTRVDF